MIAASTLPALLSSWTPVDWNTAGIDTVQNSLEAVELGILMLERTHKDEMKDARRRLNQERRDDGCTDSCAAVIP